jgi:hypothetical protein
MADGDYGDVTVSGSGTVIEINDNFAVYGKKQHTSTVTSGTYSIVLADAGSLIKFSNASAITVTAPKDATQAIPIGCYLDLMQVGAGQVTVVAESGATLQTSGLTDKTRAQYSRLGLQKVAADTWSLFGDLAAS